MLYSPPGCSLFLTAKDADISNKKPEVTSLRPVRRGWDKPHMHSAFPPVNILFTWPRMMRHHHNNAIFAYFLNGSLSNLVAKTRKQRSLHSCYRHFWDRMMKSERKTCIIDKDMVHIPFGQLCVHDDLMRSLWQAQPISWPHCQTFPIKPVIIHVA